MFRSQLFKIHESSSKCIEIRTMDLNEWFYTACSLAHNRSYIIQVKRGFEPATVRLSGTHPMSMTLGRKVLETSRENCRWDKLYLVFDTSYLAEGTYNIMYYVRYNTLCHLSTSSLCLTITGLWLNIVFFYI